MQLSGKLRGQLSTLDRSVDTLEASFAQQEANPSKHKLTTQAVAQRREALKKVTLERTRLRNLERSAPASSDRDALLGAGNGASYGRESELTRDANLQQMQARQEAEVKMQDTTLEMMSRNLDNLKTMGFAIKDEVNLQDVSRQTDSRAPNWQSALWGVERRGFLLRNALTEQPREAVCLRKYFEGGKMDAVVFLEVRAFQLQRR